MALPLDGRICQGYGDAGSLQAEGDSGFAVQGLQIGGLRLGDTNFSKMVDQLNADLAVRALGIDHFVVEMQHLFRRIFRDRIVHVALQQLVHGHIFGLSLPLQQVIFDKFIHGLALRLIVGGASLKQAAGVFRLEIGAGNFLTVNLDDHIADGG